MIEIINYIKEIEKNVSIDKGNLYTREVIKSTKYINMLMNIRLNLRGSIQ